MASLQDLIMRDKRTLYAVCNRIRLQYC